jgi:hypothetical protein
VEVREGSYKQLVISELYSSPCKKYRREVLQEAAHPTQPPAYKIVIVYSESYIKRDVQKSWGDRYDRIRCL